MNFQPVQFVPMSSYTREIIIDGGYLYVPCDNGIYVYDIDLPPTDCGDVSADGSIDIDDAVFLISYIFAGGPEPDPMEGADVDCSGAVDIDDVVYLIMYIFAGGPVPCYDC